MVTRVLSFGFKYGVPVDADLVFDLRYLPNPHFVPALAPEAPVSTGRWPPSSLLPMRRPSCWEISSALLTKLLPRYEREGKAYLTVALGCTGGRHRSVAMAERLGSRACPRWASCAWSTATRLWSRTRERPRMWSRSA